ncbi:hypothetical protein BT93_L0653 [Corymbia citriodora subsp. variegata]|uniref:Wall-associated receptor kinase galacturonan-binding domain-containing protein n=1 Tax=Corymbia citriodora subsp. variegata TaxID=360336 RepID=A0A8T0CPJ3_CORYI|nr:hypothetical protein BT93_L0653 [Corymbia citriodora subsp. variegata]
MGQDHLLVLFHLLLLHRSFGIAFENKQCTTSCGKVMNISNPFRLRGNPKACAHNKYELACINNRTILDFNSGNYSVHSINYNNYTMRVADVGLRKGNCSSLPLQSVSWGNFNWNSLHPRYIKSAVVIVGCMKAIDSPLYIDASSCLDGLQFSNFSSMRKQVYAMVDGNVSSVETGCTIELMTMISDEVDGSDLRSYEQIHGLRAFMADRSSSELSLAIDSVSNVEGIRLYLSTIASYIDLVADFSIGNILLQSS